MKEYTFRVSVTIDVLITLPRKDPEEAREQVALKVGKALSEGGVKADKGWCVVRDIQTLTVKETRSGR